MIEEHRNEVNDTLKTKLIGNDNSTEPKLTMCSNKMDKDDINFTEALAYSINMINLDINPLLVKHNVNKSVIYIPIQINEEMYPASIDIGCTVHNNLMTKEFADKNGIKYTKHKENIRTYNLTTVPTYGEIILNVMLPMGTMKQLKFIITQNGAVPILLSKQ